MANQIDAREVFIAYAECDVKREYTLHPESGLPFPKPVVKEVLQHVIKTSSADDRGFAESLYVRLSGYQEMTSGEYAVVSRIESILDPMHDKLSSAEIDALVGERDPNGVYARLSALSAAEASTLMQEIGFGSSSHG